MKKIVYTLLFLACAISTYAAQLTGKVIDAGSK